MAVWVRVERSDGGGFGDSYYVEGNYQQAAGTVGTPAQSGTGSITFETLDPSGNPNWSANADIEDTPGNSRSHPVRVTLQPVAVV